MDRNPAAAVRRPTSCAGWPTSTMARGGPTAAPMAQATQGMKSDEMIPVAAYIGSLKP